jgi:hypothetical protein
VKGVLAIVTEQANEQALLGTCVQWLLKQRMPYIDSSNAMLTCCRSTCAARYICCYVQSMLCRLDNVGAGSWSSRCYKRNHWVRLLILSTPLNEQWWPLCWDMTSVLAQYLTGGHWMGRGAHYYTDTTAHGRLCY